MSLFSIDTDRLIIKKFILEDAPFIQELLNTDGWLKYIGDRSVRSISDAEKYLKTGPLRSYDEGSFGLYNLFLKSEKKPIGTCGFLKREYLEYPDLGFALLPEYYRRGYITEAAHALLKYAKEELHLPMVQAMTKLNNSASIGLLNGLGFTKLKTMDRDGEVINLFQLQL